MTDQRRYWTIEPGRRVGPLVIGMPIAAALAALDTADLGPAGESTGRTPPSG